MPYQDRLSGESLRNGLPERVFGLKEIEVTVSLLDSVGA